MEDKTIGLADFFISIKRIELLLEELIFRQILDSNNGDMEKTNESFKNAMKNVSEDLLKHLESLAPAK